MSTDFRASKGVFQQIADNLCQQILEGVLKPGERAPTARDLSATFEVNRNTVLRSYDLLEVQGVIVNKRGVGIFIADNAEEIIHDMERAYFFKNELPDFIQKVKILRLDEQDLSSLLEVIKQNQRF